MCLFPMGGGAPQLLISPSPYAKTIAQRLKPVLLIQAAAVLGLIVTGSFLYNLINLIVIALGYFFLEFYRLLKLSLFSAFGRFAAMTAMMFKKSPVIRFSAELTPI
jgi:hypothetical protein